MEMTNSSETGRPELLPCPFCGDGAYWRQNEKEFAVKHVPGCPISNMWLWIKPYATAWNLRADLAAPQADGVIAWGVFLAGKLLGNPFADRADADEELRWWKINGKDAAHIRPLYAAPQADAMQGDRRALEEIRESYIGTEGGVAETAYEGYLLQEMDRMYKIAVDALRVSPAPQPPQSASGRERALKALRELGDSSNLDDIERNSLESAIREALTAPPAVQGQGDAVRLAIEALELIAGFSNGKTAMKYWGQWKDDADEALKALRAHPAEAPPAVEDKPLDAFLVNDSFWVRMPEKESGDA